MELPAAGASGGILVAWRRGLGLANATMLNSHCVSVQFHLSNGHCSGSDVYTAPQGYTNNKVQFLEELREVRAVCQGPWIIGDFNLIYTRMKIRTTRI